MKYKIREKLFGANKSSAIGTSLTLNGTVKYPINKLTIDGVCKQNTTTGKNLLKIDVSGDKDDIYSVVNPGNLLCTSEKLSSGTYKIYLELFTKPNADTSFSAYINNTNIVADDFNAINNYSLNTIYEKTITIDADSIVSYKIWGNTDNDNIKFRMWLLKDTEQNTVFEPYTGGQPSPSPDYPQEIKTLTGNIKLASCGKNLLDYISNLSSSSYGLTNVINIDDSITTIGKPTLNYTPIVTRTVITDILEDGQTYTISQKDANDKLYLQVDAAKEDGTISRLTTARGKSSFTVDKSTYVKYSFVIQTGSMTAWEDASTSITNKYMLCKGTDTADTSFEPYQESSLNITIPENEFVGKIDDTYKDTLNVVYKNDGHYHLILNKMIGKVVLDGTEKNLWTSQLTSTRNKTRFKFNASALNLKSVLLASQLAKAISNRFSIVTAEQTWFNKTGLSIDKTNFFIYSEDLCSMSITEFILWLSTHNIEVYFELATPYEVDLGIVDQLLTYDETTNIFTDSDLYPVINVKYYSGSLDISNYEFSIKEV